MSDKPETRKKPVRCARYDFRLSCIKYNKTKPTETIEYCPLQIQILKALLRAIAHQWVFQVEKGEQTGYYHIQGRLSLTTKSLKHPLLDQFRKWRDIIPEYAKIYKNYKPEDMTPQYLERTTNIEFLKRSFNYQMKADTRIEGPFKSDDKEIEEPEQLLEKMKKKWIFLEDVRQWYPYQQKIIDSREIRDKRGVDYIYDPVGSKGKSCISFYISKAGLGIEIPAMSDSTRMMETTYHKMKKFEDEKINPEEVLDPKMILIDIPRGVSQDQLRGICNLIESYKKGDIYDTRFSYKEITIQPPRIWVFSNVMPKLEYLSIDRWRIWTIDENMDLVKYEPPGYNLE